MTQPVVYHTCCYTTEKVYPFGFCKKCWVENGSPQTMAWNKRKVNRVEN